MTTNIVSRELNSEIFTSKGNKFNDRLNNSVGNLVLFLNTQIKKLSTNQMYYKKSVSLSISKVKVVGKTSKLY